MFIEKIRRVQQAGAVAVIVVNNRDEDPEGSDAEG
jgi:hypothetical protein